MAADAELSTRGIGSSPEPAPAPSSGPPETAGRPVLRLWAAIAATATAIAALVLVGLQALPERTGPPIEVLVVERTDLSIGRIELTVRNVGPDPVQVAQVAVNDSFVDVVGGSQEINRLETSRLVLRYPWQEGQPYTIALLTSTGVVIEHVIPAAVATPSPGGILGSMALLGLFVGVVPVVVGMLVLPLLRRARPGTVGVLLAVTVGLLGFLALDGALDAVEIGALSGGAFGGPVLVVLGATLAFLALTAVDALVGTGPDRPASGLRLATLVAVGIGLHNFGEGLAIGTAYAVGELALGAALVIGFALHNLTEGVAVVTPLATQRARLLDLAGLALIAGAPAIPGAVLGASVTNPELSTLLLGLGVGAIVRVVVVLVPAVRTRPGGTVSPSALAGIAGGVLLMYATGLLVTA
ncbi:metal transporter [Blastococcus jejuensis]|uniref:Metal transporter n=1 Tax=Blastococcus jejuensis TaxID=351224 RepID=A0ABP6NSZ1_9ACTN